MKVYLSGPITGLNYQQATAARENAALTLKAWGITPVTPMRHKDMERPEVYSATCDDPAERSRRVVARDAFDVRNCDAVLVDLRNTERVSIGTVWEMGVAYALNKPVYVVMEAGAMHEHAMTLHGIAGRFENIEDAVREIVELLQPYA